VHPDDPAWPIFGLPRIAYSEKGLEDILNLYPSPTHALCLCTGSLGSNPENDIPSIVRRFGAQGRIACMHIRNIKHLDHRRFREASHLSREGDLDMYAVVKAAYETCPDVYIRPDHGRMIWDEVGRPGYGLYDRALGAAYLNGLWEAAEKNKGEAAAVCG
jgi:mannonate dehydratase